MGKKEQIEELEKQLAEAKRKRNTGSIGIISSIILLFIFPLLGFLLLVASIAYIIIYGVRTNNLKYEMSKLK